MNSGSRVGLVSTARTLARLRQWCNKPPLNPVLARHRRDIRARLEALRQDPVPFLVAPAKVTHWSRNQLHPAITLIAFATVIMSVILSVIIHGKVRRIDNPDHKVTGRREIW
jgi:hypothetical protein